MDDKRFLKDSDNTGRFIVKSKITGKKYYIEPIGNSHAADWGDLDPATKKMTGSYGERYEGCVSEKDSIITEANGFEKSKFKILSLFIKASLLKFLYFFR